MSLKDFDALTFARLVESEQHFRRIAELTSDLIVEVDMDAKIVHMSPSVRRVLGYEADKMKGQNVFDLVHIADRKKAEDTYRRLKETGENVRLVLRILKSDGSFLWGDCVAQLFRDDKNKVTGAFATIRDVSEQQKALAMLRRKNTELHTLQMAVTNAFNHIIVTDEDGKIFFANKGAERLTGYSFAEMLGQRPSLWGKQMPPSFYEEFWHQIKELRKPFHGEIINRKKSGELYRAIATVTPIINEKDELVGFVGVEEDISSFKPPELPKPAKRSKK